MTTYTEYLPCAAVVGTMTRPLVVEPGRREDFLGVREPDSGEPGGHVVVFAAFE